MSKMTAQERVNELKAQNENFGATILKGILKAEGYSKEEIASADIPSHRSNEIDAHEIMRVIIRMEENGDSRKDIAEHLHNTGLCGEATARHIMGLMKFVKAYYEIMTGQE